jgi:hypothetical protein
MFPALHLEATLRIVYDSERRLGRYQVEVADASTHELLALRSRPFHEGLSAQETQEEASKWLSEAIAALLDPEPFP